jgi:hypothetical protein
VKDSGKGESTEESTEQSTQLEQDPASTVIDGEVTNKERDSA